MKNLNPSIVGIYDKNPIVVIDEDPGGQLEFPEFATPLSKVVKQLALAIKDLHDSPQGVGNKEVSF